MERTFHILHLEQNLKDAELIGNAVQKALPNAIVNHVSDKVSFLNELKNKKYELVILNFVVTGIKGLEATKWALSINPDLHVIYVMPAKSELNEVELLNEGVTDYVYKDNLDKIPFAVMRALKCIDDAKLMKVKEEQIRQSKAFKESILNALSTHIAVIDEDGVIVETNHAWNEFAEKHGEKNLSGIPVGSNYFDSLREFESDSDSSTSLVDNIVKVINGEYGYFYHDYPNHLPQKERWYTMRVTPRLDKKGAVISHSNITDRIVIEKKFRDRERDFRSITENAPNHIVKINKRLQIQYVNRDVFDTPKDQLIGTSVFDVIDPKNHDLVKSKIEEVFETGNSTFLHAYRNREGEQPMYIGTTFGPILNDKGEVESIIAILRDLTEEHKDKELLKMSEQKYRGIFEGLTEGIMHTDKVGKIISVNPGFCKMLGYSKNEIIGKIGYNKLHEPEVGNRLKQKLKHRAKGNAGQYEACFLRKNGEKIWTQVSASPQFDKEGEFVGVMSIIINITERKRAEVEAIKMKELFTQELENKVLARTKELEQARIELAKSLEKEKELSQLKSRFVSTASHQFRTPLSVIQTSMGVLAMQENQMTTEFNANFQRIYSRVKDQIQRMTDLMNDVLILGKINEGNITLRLKEHDLLEISDEVIKSYSVLMETHKIEKVVIGKPYKVKLDKQLFEHALSNFISNALKYSPENSVTGVQIRFDKKHVTIVVKDNGIGIPANDLEHLFDPFFRASNVREVNGTGLGTAIAKEYIELIGGKVSVTSVEGEGSEFTIKLNKN